MSASLNTLYINADSPYTHHDLREFASHLEGVCFLSTHDIEADIADYEWFENSQPDDLQLPVSAQALREHLAATDQSQRTMATVSFNIGQELYQQAVAHPDPDFLENVLHEKSFAFGIPTDCSYKIVGVVEDDFIIEYTTDLTQWLDPDVDQEQL